LVDEIEQDKADAIEAVAEQGFEGALESFLKGIGCAWLWISPTR